MARKFLVEITMTDEYEPDYFEELEESDDIEKIVVLKVLDE